MSHNLILQPRQTELKIYVHFIKLNNHSSFSKFLKLLKAINASCSQIERPQIAKI